MARGGSSGFGVHHAPIFALISMRALPVLVSLLSRLLHLSDLLSAGSPFRCRIYDESAVKVLSVREETVVGEKARFESEFAWHGIGAGSALPGGSAT